MDSSIEEYEEKIYLREHSSRRLRALSVAVLNHMLQWATFLSFYAAIVLAHPKSDPETVHIAQRFYKCSITFTICMVFLSALLVIGVFETKPKLILIYLCVGFIRVLIFISICGVFLTMAYFTTGPIENMLWTFFRFLSYLLIDGFVLIKMYYYYRKLQNQTFEEVV